MHPHRRVAVTHMRPKHQGDGRILTLPPALAFRREPHGVGMRHIAFQRLENGGPHRRGPVTVEQTRQTGGDGAKVGATLGATSQQGPAGGHRARATFIAAMPTRRVFFMGQRLGMSGRPLRWLAVLPRLQHPSQTVQASGRGLNFKPTPLEGTLTPSVRRSNQALTLLCGSDSASRVEVRMLTNAGTSSTNLAVSMSNRITALAISISSLSLIHI